MKRLLLILISIGSTASLWGQSLSLDQAILIAQDSTIAAHQSYNAVMGSRWDYNTFLAGRRPQLSFNLEPNVRWNSTDPFLRYYKLQDYNLLNAFGEFRLEQQGLLSGGNYYASTAVLLTMMPGSAPTVFYPTTTPLAVGYSNSLLGYNSHKWDKKINDYHIESREKEYLFNLAKIALEAQGYYIDYLVASSLYKIHESNSKVALKMLEIGREKYAIAAMSKNELCALELQYINEENLLFSAVQDVQSARNSLLSYLNVDDYGQEIEMAEPELPAYISISPQAALSLARANNPEFRDYSEKVLSADKSLAKAKVQASFLQSAIDVNLGMQGEHWYNWRTPFFVGGISLRIPIFDGGLARSRRTAAEYKLANAESLRDEADRKLELKVNNAIREFNIQQDLILRTRKALNLADESFELARELYGNGETDINTFILAQQRKDDAHKNYLSSLKQYWNRYYTLQCLCVTELKDIN